jgi:Global regulator protein family
MNRPVIAHPHAQPGGILLLFNTEVVMLVLTRRPGEAIFIGDHLEIMIVDADWQDLEARFAISAIDAEGNDLRLQPIKTRAGSTVVKIADPTR